MELQGVVCLHGIYEIYRSLHYVNVWINTNRCINNYMINVNDSDYDSDSVSGSVNDSVSVISTTLAYLSSPRSPLSTIMIVLYPSNRTTANNDGLCIVVLGTICNAVYSTLKWSIIHNSYHCCHLENFKLQICSLYLFYYLFCLFMLVLLM